MLIWIRFIRSNIGQVLQAYLSKPLSSMISGQTYDLCSLNLPNGKWLVFGQTLAGGDLVIDGNISIHINGRNNVASAEASVVALAYSTGGVVNLKLVSNSIGTAHADSNYCALKAIRIG